MPTCALLPVTSKIQLHTNVMQSYRDARDCEALQLCAYSSCVKRAVRTCLSSNVQRYERSVHNHMRAWQSALCSISCVSLGPCTSVMTAGSRVRALWIPIRLSRAKGQPRAAERTWAQPTTRCQKARASARGHVQCGNICRGRGKRPDTLGSEVVSTW